MKKILMILLFAFAVQVQGQSIFNGFKILNAPRENIPLGAEWINNVGVNGEGTSEDNIIIEMV